MLIGCRGYDDKTKSSDSAENKNMSRLSLLSDEIEMEVRRQREEINQN